MQDYIIKATAYDYQVRAYAVRSSHTIEEVRRRHELMPLAATAMGRAMSATVLLSSMLKGNEQITVQIKGDGPIGSLLIDANTIGDVRGYVSNPKAYVPLTEDNHLDIANAVGSIGTMTVTRKNGNNTPFIGQIPLISGEIGDDFAFYLSNSEQIPSVVGVSTLINKDFTIQAAGGFMIQLLPGTDVSIIKQIEDRIQQVTSLTTMLQQQLSPEAILTAILGEEILEIEKMPIQFKCECSRERIANIIISLGKEEIKDMMETDRQANAECHFCNEHYLFDYDQLEILLHEAN